MLHRLIERLSRIKLDTLLHFVGGMLISGILVMILFLFIKNVYVVCGISFFLTFMATLFKEYYYDKKYNGSIEVRDIKNGMLGSVLAILYCLYLLLI